MKELKFVMIGAGFWAQYQLPGWLEIPGLRCVGVWNRTRARAEDLAARFGIERVWDDADAMVAESGCDFVDVLTQVETHARYVELAIRHRKPVVCQKPMATSLEEARRMVALSRSTGVPLLINENWRWQSSIRALKAVLDSGAIGRPFRGRIQFSCTFPVWVNQPALAELEQFLLTDIGSHILDTARFLFGEAKTLDCATSKVCGLKGEDVATCFMRMTGCDAVTCEMSYASRMEDESFPETYAVVEGTLGVVQLRRGYELRVTTEHGTTVSHAPPPSYPWLDPRYQLVHSSIVAAQRDLASALRGDSQAETTGEDNLRTVELVFGAYASARSSRSTSPGG